MFYRVAVVLFALASNFHIFPAFAQDNLPIEVRADLLQGEINDALKAGDFPKALQGMDAYRKLGRPIAPSLLYLEARASVAAGDLVRAKRVFEQYFAGGGQQDAGYQEALVLYRQILPQAQAAEEKAKAEAEAAAAKAKADAETAKESERARSLSQLACDGCPIMVLVPAGTFQMGGIEEYQKPVHSVTFSKAFAIGAYEVTFTEWDSCVAAGGCKQTPNDRKWGRGTRPVMNVSWNDIQEYIVWLNAKTGKKFRLPSEAEWEYAARAGTTTTYAWGNEIGVNRANCLDCGSSFSGSFSSRSAPVGSFAPNALGLHDMHGNVWEWVADCWHDSYAGAPQDGRAWTEQCSGEVLRILRGGAFADYFPVLRSGGRSGSPPSRRSSGGGFRLVMDLE